MVNIYFDLSRSHTRLKLRECFEEKSESRRNMALSYTLVRERRALLPMKGMISEKKGFRRKKSGNNGHARNRVCLRDKTKS